MTSKTDFQRTKKRDTAIKNNTENILCTLSPQLDTFVARRYLEQKRMRKLSFFRLLPFYFLLILIFCNISIISAQSDSCQKAANKASETLVEIMDKIKQLDLMISNNIYGNFTSADINKYEKRFIEAQGILFKLDTIDNISFKCADKNPNDQSYLLYSSISKLTALGIVSQKSSYINYLKTDKQNEKRYDDIKVKWEEKEKELIKTAKSQINKTLIFDKENGYVQTLLGVCDFYDKKQDKAINELTSIAANIKEKISKTEEKTRETTGQEKLLSFTLTWLGYIYFDKMTTVSAMSSFEEVNNIDEPDYKSVEWINNATKQMKDAKIKTQDLKVPEFYLPLENNSIRSNFRILKYQKNNPLKTTVINQFDMIDSSTQIITDQKELIKQTIDVWTKLRQIENTPWQFYIARMQKSGGKFHRQDYDKIYLKMTAANKGGRTTNLLLYRERFTSAYTVLNQLLFLRQCWTNLINNNPELTFFRLYRIKVDLGISYLNQNAKTFTDFFDYYKIKTKFLKKKKKIPSEYITKIKDDFETNPMNEINEDIKYYNNDNTNNITYLLTKAEIAVFTQEPGNALLILKDIEQKIPPKTTVENIDPSSIIELYCSFLHFKMRETNELKQSVQVLNSYSDMADWTKHLKEYIYCIENEKLIMLRKVKVPFITSAPPFQPFFPERVGISYFSPPPLMLPPDKIINEIEISSQYFKIAVPRVLDYTGKAEAIKNLIDEQFVTAFGITNRFTVMDKGTMMNLVQWDYTTGTYIESRGTKYNNKPDSVPINNLSAMNNSELQTNTSQLFGYFERYPLKYEAYLTVIKKYTDGILKISINGYDDKKKIIDIDYKINSSLSDNYILYTGKGKIAFTMEKGTATLTLKRKDIEDIVKEIEKNFPNPDSKSLIVEQVNGKKITVNAGKNENIKTGMLGYVTKKEVSGTIAYIAMFEITEVFEHASNAELTVDPKMESKVILQEFKQYTELFNTIKVGDDVKMK